MKRYLPTLAALLLLGGTAYAATVPVTTAFYNDSLQAGITTTQTSMTLVSGKDAQGVSLSGAYDFVIDQGTASQEIVDCTTVSGTAVSGCTRGVDLTTGTSSVTALEFVHNRGASVQITTAPVVNIMANILRAVEGIGQPIFYSSSVSTSTIASNRANLASAGLVADTAFAGASVINATNAARGIVSIATGLQAASSTALGAGPGGASYVLPTSIATDTPNAGSNTSDVLMSDLTGHLKQAWIDLTAAFTWTGTQIFNGSATFNKTTSFTATTTFSGATNVPITLVSTSTPATFNSNGSFVTLWQYAIPANTIGKNDTLRINAYFKDTQGCGSNGFGQFVFGTGSATTTVASTTLPASGGLQVSGTLSNQGATNAQYANFTSATSTTADGTGVPLSFGRTALTSAYDTTAQTYLAARYYCGNGANASIENVTVEKISNQ